MKKVSASKESVKQTSYMCLPVYQPRSCLIEPLPHWPLSDLVLQVQHNRYLGTLGVHSCSVS